MLLFLAEAKEPIEGDFLLFQYTHQRRDFLPLSHNKHHSTANVLLLDGVPLVLHIFQILIEHIAIEGHDLMLWCRFAIEGKWAFGSRRHDSFEFKVAMIMQKVKEVLKLNSSHQLIETYSIIFSFKKLILNWPLAYIFQYFHELCKL